MFRFLNLSLSCLLICLLAGCQSGAEEKATDFHTLISEAYNYPRPILHSLYLTDPRNAKKLMDAGLEEQGYVTIRKKLTMAEAGKPLITFTPEGEKFIHSTDQANPNRVEVIAATLTLKEINAFEMNDKQDRLTFSYTVEITDETPFAFLSKPRWSKDMNRKGYFEKVEGKWVKAPKPPKD
ncbi:hypothetical protein AB9P05_00645 [Roseivirga sp. BDSF3-8]|uniref:hypothetical protein n=1 Tax=Roseivirga sp. BDSF3-8 TaxID=3241598 RepID=UPI003531EDDE